MPKIEQVITAKDQASGVLKGFTGSMIKAQLSVEALKMAARELTKVVGESINAFAEQEASTARLNAVLKSTGGIVGLTSKELIDLSGQFQNTTRFGDEVIQSAEAVMLTFTKIGKDVFPEALMAAANMAETLGTDLQSAVVQVGKTMNDFSGYTALKRAGVSFTEEQINMIEGFKETNDLASYQALILEELNTEFGGVAQAMGDTTAGSFAKLDNAIGDLSESFGALILSVTPAIDAAIGFVNALNDIVTISAKMDTKSISQYSSILEKMVEDGYSIDEALEGVATITGKTKYQAEQLYLINDDLKTIYQEQRDLLEEQNTLSSEILANMLEALGREQDRIQVEKDRQTEAEKWLSDYTGYLNEIETELDKVEERRAFAEIMGDDFDYVAEKTKVLENAIGSLVDNGYSLEGDTIQGIIEEYRELTDLYGDVANSSGASAGEIKQRMSEVSDSMGEMGGVSGKVSDDMEDDWKDTFDTILSLAGEFMGQFGSIIGKMGDIVSLEYQNQIDALERSLEQQLNAIDEWAQQQMELYGVAEETRQEQLEREVGELEDAIDAETDAEEKARLQKLLEEKQAELLRQQILDEAAEKKKEAEKKTAMEKWRLEVQQFKAEQSYKKAQTWIDYGAGLTAAAGRAAGMGFILGPIYMAAMTGLLSTNLGMSLGYINKQQPPPKPTFENSGIVPGSSYHGDNVDIRANSREMYLNLNDQASLLNMIKRGSGGGMNIGTISLPNVKNAAQFVKDLKEIQRRERVLA
jgi:hypothetical protein